MNENVNVREWRGSSSQVRWRMETFNTFFALNGFSQHRSDGKLQLKRCFCFTLKKETQQSLYPCTLSDMNSLNEYVQMGSVREQNSHFLTWPFRDVDPGCAVWLDSMC